LVAFQKLAATWTTATNLAVQGSGFFVVSDPSGALLRLDHLGKLSRKIDSRAFERGRIDCAENAGAGDLRTTRQPVIRLPAD
jgi:hypothetical protein